MHYGIKSNVARRLMVKVERLLGLWNKGEDWGDCIEGDRRACKCPVKLFGTSVLIILYDPNSLWV